VNPSYSTAVDQTEGAHSLKILSITGLRARRAALAAVSVAAAFAIPLAFVPPSAAVTSVTAGSGPKPTIVLVHGAFADGSSWDAVVSRLQQDGYTVDVPPNPLEGLFYDSATVRDFLDTISGPVVLVGHSYGGSVITNAATGDPNVKALVYVDALAPAQGQTMAQLIGAVPGSCVGSANRDRAAAEHRRVYPAERRACLEDHPVLGGDRHRGSCDSGRRAVGDDEGGSSRHYLISVAGAHYR
jgi:pimeloyl-ACP methyl ester carboxylesterase